MVFRLLPVDSLFEGGVLTGEQRRKRVRWAADLPSMLALTIALVRVVAILIRIYIRLLRISRLCSLYLLARGARVTPKPVRRLT